MASALSSRSGSTRRSISNLQVTSTTLSHAINSIDNTKPAVVIEIGRKLTKCGFAGDLQPRAICRTEFLDENLVLRTDVLEGTQNRHKSAEGTLLRFFKKLFYSHLLSMPRERRVVIVESVLCASEFRRSICKVLLEVMDVPSVMFLPAHLAATLTFNTDNALVLDVGYTETTVIPVAEGVTMLNHMGISSIGGRSLETRVADLLLEHAEIEGTNGKCRKLEQLDLEKMKEKNLVEDICVRYLFCTTRERGIKIQQNGPTVELESKIKDCRLAFGHETLVLPGFIREAACEILFENKSEDDLAIPEMIHGVIARLPIDMRKKFFSGILPTGGSSLIYGFLARLKEELTFIGQERQLKTAQEVKFFRFDGQALELYVGWLGGSMFSAVQEAVQCRSVSREHWLDKGTIPDWTDFVEHNRPSGRVDLGG